MSPRRIEIKDVIPSGIYITTIKESDRGFLVGPADVQRILGIPRTTLLHHDGEGVERIPSHRSARTKDQREYTDVGLLRIAAETGRSELQKHDSGNAMLVTESATTVLDIPWNEAEAIYWKIAGSKRI